jgi:FAD:protein FMN transferase
MKLARRFFRRLHGLTLVRELHYAMGTLLDVMLYHAEREVGLGLLREACRETQRLNALLSRHLPTSELSGLNTRAGQGPCTVSPELFALLAVARQWAEETQGAFDPTVGGGLTLWHEAARREECPTAADLQAARCQAGWSKLRLTPPCQVELITTGMSLDLGGIGKGYAVDCMGTILRQSGIRHALINFGESSLLAIGPMPDGRPWPILVRALDSAVGVGWLAIQDQAVGTSASFGHTFTLAGKPLSHILDPRHGRPLEHPLAVTVVAPTATAAEALSTALLVLTVAGEPVTTLPCGTSAYQVNPDGGVIPLGRTLHHAELRCPWL